MALIWHLIELANLAGLVWLWWRFRTEMPAIWAVLKIAHEVLTIEHGRVSRLEVSLPEAPIIPTSNVRYTQ